MSQGRTIMQIHTHHITYDPEYWPEWTVEVPGYFHRTITWITRMKDTDENYAMWVSMLHAMMHECNKRRMILDTEKANIRAARKAKNDT